MCIKYFFFFLISRNIKPVFINPIYPPCNINIAKEAYYLESSTYRLQYNYYHQVDKKTFPQTLSQMISSDIYMSKTLHISYSCIIFIVSQIILFRYFKYNSLDLKKGVFKELLLRLTFLLLLVGADI